MPCRQLLDGWLKNLYGSFDESGGWERRWELTTVLALEISRVVLIATPPQELSMQANNHL